jgi:hypothetical protein
VRHLVLADVEIGVYEKMRYGIASRAYEHEGYRECEYLNLPGRELRLIGKGKRQKQERQFGLQVIAPFALNV